MRRRAIGAFIVIALVAAFIPRTSSVTPYRWTPTDDLMEYPVHPLAVASARDTLVTSPSPTARGPEQTRRPTPAPTHRPGTFPPRSPGGRHLSGVATWYRYVPGGAAAGPGLRRWLGPDWRGQWVTVCAGSCVRAHLTDWCLCGRGDRVIDLDSRLFAQLAPLGQGVVKVEVSR